MRQFDVHRHQRRWRITAGIVAAMGFTHPTLADGGVGTASSREAAIQQATALMPEDSAITDADCTLQSGGGLSIDTCTVEREP